MKLNLSKQELAGSAAVLVYIVFFASRPPAVLQSVLGSPVGLALAFLASLGVTFYHSKVVGGLLLLALLLSMTRVTEHLTEQEKSDIQKQLDEAKKTWEELKKGGFSEANAGSNAAVKKTLDTIKDLEQKLAAPSAPTPPPAPETKAAPGPVSPPPVAPSGQAAAGEAPRPQPTTAPAPMPPTTAPALTSVPPRPVMACNIESFAPY